MQPCSLRGLCNKLSVVQHLGTAADFARCLQRAAESLQRALFYCRQQLCFTATSCGRIAWACWWMSSHTGVQCSFARRASGCLMRQYRASPTALVDTTDSSLGGKQRELASASPHAPAYLLLMLRRLQQSWPRLPLARRISGLPIGTPWRSSCPGFL